MEPDAMNKLKYSRLNGYINSLYGKPIYSRDDEKLNEVYQSFAYQPDHTMPLTYWETEKSKIVLLYFEDKEEDYTNIYMHAEPINQ